MLPKGRITLDVDLVMQVISINGSKKKRNARKQKYEAKLSGRIESLVLFIVIK